MLTVAALIFIGAAGMLISVGTLLGMWRAARRIDQERSTDVGY
jgi:hypothetical protein